MLDMLVYGIWMAALCLTCFVLILYAWANGDADLGDNCNNEYNSSCEVVFRARSATFACLTWFALFLAWEMVNMRRSFFRMQPKSKLYFTQWMHDVWRNPFLFWSIVAGIFTMFPIIYIPGLNKEVFKHAPITWEWGIVFVEAVLFFGGVEAWKWAKRIYFRRVNRKKTGDVKDLEEKTFGHYFKSNMSGDEESGLGNDSQNDLEKKKVTSPEPPLAPAANGVSGTVNGDSEKKAEV